MNYNGADTLIAFGGAVKSLGRNKVGGRVVTFSGARDPDRVKEYFDERTNFWELDRKPILYRHGMDRAIKRRRFGSVELTKASDGIWAEGTITGADDHSRRLLEMVALGELKWSTGSVGHLFEKTPTGGAFHIDLWPIVECSLCEQDTVAEPRNLATLKSLAVTDFDTFAPRSRKYNVYQQRAAQAYAASLMLEIELNRQELEQSRREFERSRHDDARTEEQNIYTALAKLKIAEYERIRKG